MALAIPSTGTDWETGGYNDIDSRFFLRGGRQAVLIRQSQGTLTDLSPAAWSPAALDGTLRGDLFAQKRVAGNWITNPVANDGWLLLGAFKEGNGPSEESKLSKDDFMVEQINQPYDSDIVKEEVTIKVTPVETLRPYIKNIRHNLPILDSSGNFILQDPGQLGAFWGTPIDTDPVEWQLLTLHARRKGGKTIVVANGYPLCKVVDKGNSKMDKKDSDGSELSFEPLPDGIMVDPQGRPILFGEWVLGDGWTALGGVPVFPGVAPVATLGTTGKASFVFTAVTGTGDPFTITAQSTIDDGVTWIAATLDTPGAVVTSGGNTTVKVKSVAAGSTKFRAQAVGTNGAIAYSLKSNAVTIT